MLATDVRKPVDARANRLRDCLQRPAVSIAIATGLFIIQFAVVASIMGDPSQYNLQGMWITIPDFVQRLNDGDSLLERIFIRLNGWDGHWYHHIASHGYQCTTIPEGNNPHLCNVGFFPLLPLLGAALGKVGIDLVYALPLISQAAWFATIVSILLFARSIATLQPLHLVVVLLLVAYPGGLYGFAAYSESLLTLLVVLIAILTYSYLEGARKTLLVALALCCFLLGLVKVTGVIAAAIPVLMAWLHPAFEGRKFTREQLAIYAASTSSLLGIASFLLYCELRFDDWALYFRYVGSAWGTGSENGLSLNPLRIFTGFSWHENLSVRISNIIVISLPAVIAALGAVSWRFGDRLRHFSIAVLATALLLFYFYSVPGNNDKLLNFNIMRHMLPVVALLTLLAMSMPLSRLRRAPAGAIALGLLALVYLQFHFQMKMFDAFKFGYWVS